MPPNKNKHKTPTIENKLNALKRSDNGKIITNLTKEFYVEKSKICDWKKNVRIESNMHLLLSNLSKLARQHNSLRMINLMMHFLYGLSKKEKEELP